MYLLSVFNNVFFSLFHELYCADYLGCASQCQQWRDLVELLDGFQFQIKCQVRNLKYDVKLSQISTIFLLLQLQRLLVVELTLSGFENLVAS